MTETKKMYVYSGPVMQFGKCIGKVENRKTFAATSKKALSNIAYNYKKQYGLVPSAKIELVDSYLVEGGQLWHI